MKRTVLMTALLIGLVGDARAANSRSQRTAWQYQRYAVQQQRLNQQWVQSFQALKDDQRRAWQDHDRNTRTWQMWYQNQMLRLRYQKHWNAVQQRAWHR